MHVSWGDAHLQDGAGLWRGARRHANHQVIFGHRTRLARVVALEMAVNIGIRTQFLGDVYHHRDGANPVLGGGLQVLGAETDGDHVVVGLNHGVFLGLEISTEAP